MKKVNFLIAGMFFFLLSMGLNAQTQTGADYFAGRWNVLVKGTPSGDSKMIFNLEKKDSTMTGVIVDSTGTEISKISSADLGENELTLFFNVTGYDVNLTLNIKDEDNVTGSLLGMFEAEGTRIKESE